MTISFDLASGETSKSVFEEMETLTIFDENKNLVDLHIRTSSNFPPDLGLWYVDNNTLFLGSDKKEEWDSIQGRRPKQQLFLAKLKQVSNRLL